MMAANNQELAVSLENDSGKRKTAQRKTASEEFGEISKPLESSTTAYPLSNRNSESNSSDSEIIKHNKMLNKMLDGFPSVQSADLTPTAESVVFPCSSKTPNVDETSVFKIPEVPPLRVKARMKKIDEIYREFYAEKKAAEENLSLAAFYSNLKNTDSHVQDKELEPADKLYADLESKLCAVAMSETEVKACQLKSDPFELKGQLGVAAISEMVASTDAANVARDNLLKALDSIFAECSKDMPVSEFNFPPGEEHFKMFYKEFIKKMYVFQSDLELCVEFIHAMPHDPFLNASVLVLRVFDVLDKAKRVENSWIAFHQLRENNSTSTTVKTMNFYFCRCHNFTNEISEAVNKYLKTLPHYYPQQCKNFDEGSV